MTSKSCSIILRCQRRGTPDSIMLTISSSSSLLTTAIPGAAVGNLGRYTFKSLQVPVVLKYGTLSSVCVVKYAEFRARVRSRYISTQKFSARAVTTTCTFCAAPCYIFPLAPSVFSLPPADYICLRPTNLSPAPRYTSTLRLV